MPVVAASIGGWYLGYREAPFASPTPVNQHTNCSSPLAQFLHNGLLFQLRPVQSSGFASQLTQKIGHCRDVRPSHSFITMTLKKLNLSEQMQMCTNKPKDDVTQSKHKNSSQSWLPCRMSDLKGYVLSCSYRARDCMVP